MSMKENLSCNEYKWETIVASKASYFMHTSSDDVADTLVATDYKDPQLVCYKKQGHPQNAEQAQGWEETKVNDTLNAFDNGETRTPTIVPENHPADSRVTISKDNVVQTLSSRMGTGGNNTPMVMQEQKYENLVVRRLTPLECERLQGFPDGWTDIGEWVDSKGKKHKPSDTPRYKALGNSIGLPHWEWLAGRMVEQLKKDGVEEPKMCSLFDGIGGFPLVFSRCGCEPVWASEIEEFPIAVTKKRFPEKGEDENDAADFRHTAEESGDYRAL